MLNETRADLLKALISPETVAIIGASATPGKLTARPVTFLQAQGFKGRIYPINPSRAEVQGLEAFPSLDRVPEPIDHAYVLLDTDAAVEAVATCADAGVKVVTLLADGFAEAGAAGLAKQHRIATLAGEAGMLLVGPNSTGVVTVRNGFCCTTNAAFGAARIKAGGIAVLSQSGSVIGTIMSRGNARGTGFSSLISVGNEGAADVAALGSLLLDDDSTTSFVLFLETIRDAKALAAFAAKANARGKPVVAYMIGQSDEGQALSVSHTGALTGSREATAAFLKAIGIQQVQTFETLFEAPAALGLRPRLTGRPRAVTVVSTTGGGGAMLVDQLSARGVRIAGVSAPSRDYFREQGIRIGSGKLVDVTLAGTKYETMKAVISRLSSDPETGVLVVAIGSSAQFNPDLAVKPIIDAVAEGNAADAAVLAFPLPDAPDALTMLSDGGIPAFRTVESCAESVSLMLRKAVRADSPDLERHEDAFALVAGHPSPVLNELASSAVFTALGLRVPQHVLLEPGSAGAKGLPFPFPVVVKLVSDDLPHKTEAGAIKVGITSEGDLEAAIAAMKSQVRKVAPAARIQGILVQEMCKGIGEVLVGVTRDPLVGPIVTVAMGGVMTEIYRDVALRPAPVSPSVAAEMISEVKGFEVLRGFRGKRPGDLNALANAVSQISKTALCDVIAEAEVNPILVLAEGEGVILLDALITKDIPPS